MKAKITDQWYDPLLPSAPQVSRVEIFPGTSAENELTRWFLTCSMHSQCSKQIVCCWHPGLPASLDGLYPDLFSSGVDGFPDLCGPALQLDQDAPAELTSFLVPESVQTEDHPERIATNSLALVSQFFVQQSGQNGQFFEWNSRHRKGPSSPALLRLVPASGLPACDSLGLLNFFDPLFDRFRVEK